MQAYWAANPFYKVAYDQLLNGPTNVATAGSVIGNYTGVRDAVRDAENSMFLNGTDPKAALKSAADQRHVGDRRLQQPPRRRVAAQPRSSMAT